MQGSGLMAKFEIDGLDDLEKMIKELGKLPQKCVTQSAKDGAKIALASAKVKAPKDTGDLRKGIIIKGEKKTVSGKKVYDVMMDPAMNDVFVKVTKEGKRYYYPASQEFGFITKKGKKTEGHHFLRDALVDNKAQIEAKVIEKLSQLIDKEMRR
jgi:HK97 gp10 family phage protein